VKKVMAVLGRLAILLFGSEFSGHRPVLSSVFLTLKRLRKDRFCSPPMSSPFTFLYIITSNPLTFPIP
jgi:hypothetical protein